MKALSDVMYRLHHDVTESSMMKALIDVMYGLHHDVTESSLVIVYFPLQNSKVL